MGYYGVNTENSIQLSEDLSNCVTMAKPKKDQRKRKKRKWTRQPQLLKRNGINEWLFP